MTGCPKTSQLKRELRGAYWKDGKVAKAVQRNGVREGGCTHDEISGRYRFNLDNNVEDVALGHRISFHVMPYSIREELISSNDNISPKEFTEPINLRTAILDATGNWIQFTACKTVTTAINFIVPKSEFPVTVRGVEFIAVGQAMEEIILGRLLLQATSFDLRTNLEEIGQSFHNQHVDEMSSEPEKIHKSAYAGFSYRRRDYEPIAAIRSIAAGFSANSKEDNHEAFELIVSDVVTH